MKSLLKYAIIILLLNLDSALQQTETCDPLEDDDEHIFPTNKEYKSQEKKLCLDFGFQLKVTVEIVDTSLNGDYLLIKKGETSTDEGQGIIFTQSLDKPHTFVVDSNQIFIRFNVDDPTQCLECKGVSIKYKRIGKIIDTTTVNPIETSTWPQPGTHDSIYYTGYVSGHEYDYYQQVDNRKALQKAVAKMAIKYSSINFPLANEISESNVLLYTIKPCEYSWPDSNKCVAIRFAIPIILDESVQSGYELRTLHLIPMWERYASEYLKEFGFEFYKTPNIDAVTTSWGLIIGILLLLSLLSIGIMVLIKDGTFRCFKKMSRRPSDTRSIIEKEYRDSQTSLSPHPLQLQSFPQIFEVDIRPTPNRNSENADIYDEMDSSIQHQFSFNSDNQGNETET